MAGNSKKTSYRFTFGPWNISTGADPLVGDVDKAAARDSLLLEAFERSKDL